MLSMNFVIPLNKDELLDNNFSDQYFVREVAPVELLPSFLSECSESLKLEGSYFILQQFDPLFSFLVHFKDLEFPLIAKEWSFLKNAFAHLIGSLSVLLEESGGDEPQKDGEDKGSSLDTETRLRTLNSLRMLTYIYGQTFVHWEDRLTKKNLMAPPEAKKGRKKGRNAGGIGVEEDQYDCDDKRQDILSHFYALLQLPINRLWEPPIAEEEFINLIANCCYKILEDPAINSVRLRHVRESIFQVLGTLIKRHNHGLSCSLKIVQLLKLYEHTSSPLAQGLVSFAGPSMGCRSMVREVLREISETDPGEFSADASGTKAICHFLSELVVGLPSLVQASVSLILPQLSFESYTMRICVLGVITELVSQLLSGEDLEESDKKSRDLFLDHLEGHMQDINAFVRSKVMQYWQRLCREKAVPLTRQHDVLEKAIRRLRDKSNLVRKFALQLVRAFLEGNPFTARLGLKDLLTQLQAEKQTLADLEKKYGLSDKDKEEPTQKSETTASVDPEKKAEWKTMEPKILEAIYNLLEKDTNEELEEGELESAMEMPLKGFYNRLVKTLLDGEYNVAAKLLIVAKAKHPDARNMKISEDDDGEDVMSDKESEKVLSEEESSPVKQKKRTKRIKKRMRYLGKLLRKIFLENSRDEATDETENEAKNSEEVRENNPTSSDTNALDADAMEKIQMQSALVQFLEDSVIFARLVSELAIPHVCRLLSSNHSTDVLEAIDFFTSAYKFGLSDAKQGVREMLPLVFSKDPAVKVAVGNAYAKLYLLPEDKKDKESDAVDEEEQEQEPEQTDVRRNPRARAVQVVRNLTGLIVGADMGERDSLEELMCHWVTSEVIDACCIKVLWERFSGTLPGTTLDESRAAAVLLGMIAGAEIQTIWTNLDVMVKVGLKGERGQLENEEPRDDVRFDSLMVAETCEALLRMCKTHKKKQEAIDPPLRLPSDHVIFTTLSDIMIKGMSDFKDNFYIPMVAVAVDVIYQMAEQPDSICGEIIKETCILIRDQYMSDNDLKETQTQNREDDALNQPKELMGPPAPPPLPQSKYMQIPKDILSRLMFIVGHVAFRQFIYLDTQVFSELKRRNTVREKLQEKLQDGKKGKQKTRKTASSSVNSSKTMSLSASEKSRLEQTKSEDGDDDVIGAVADDAEAEFIRNVCETELVTGTNLLSLLCPMVVMVCSKPKKYNDKTLRVSVVLALAKIMCVSSIMCQKYMQLLVTVMERSPEPVIRANCIIALGDLCYRFPNITEPWSPNLYGRLRDESVKVRQNTLMVLTHLIMNDMVKVKGQISDMALCILDSSQKLSEIAKLFFQELSQKGNALYNVMTDIISRLSNPALGVPEESFQTILSFLMNLIQKDRQVDSLVEKLCLRFQTTSSGAFMEKIPTGNVPLTQPEVREMAEKEGNPEEPNNDMAKTSDEVGKDSRDEGEKRQWRDLAFCLTLLPYNSERAIRRLMSHLSCYADKIAKEPQVYSSFMAIVAASRKNAKPDMKVVIDELEQKIEDCVATADEDGNVVIRKPVQTPAKKGTSAAPKSVTRSTRRRRKPVASSSESDFDSPDENKARRPQTAKKSIQKRRGRARRASVDSDDEEVQPAPRTSRNARRKVTYEESGSEKENEAQGSPENSGTPSPETKRQKRGVPNSKKSSKKAPMKAR